MGTKQGANTKTTLGAKTKITHGATTETTLGADTNAKTTFPRCPHVPSRAHDVPKRFQDPPKSSEALRFAYTVLGHIVDAECLLALLVEYILDASFYFQYSWKRLAPRRRQYIPRWLLNAPRHTHFAAIGFRSSGMHRKWHVLLLIFLDAFP